MLTTEAGVYDRVKTQLGKLSRRLEAPLVQPSESDEDALQIYLEDALSEIATITERVNTSVQLSTIPGQAYVPRPSYVHMLQKGAVYDGSTAYELKKQDGADVARWSRAPDAEEGRPTHIGAYESRLYFWPVPDTEYTTDLQVTYNGDVSDTAPAGPQDAPQIDTVVEHVPAELDRALAAYVTAEWLKEIGQPEVAAEATERFERDVRRFKEEPVHQSTSTRKYNPLGL